MLQLRFQGDVDLKVARQRFGKITKVLAHVFEHHCGAFEFGRKGSVHAHLYVVAHENIASGFNWFAYREFVALRREGRPSWMSEEDYRQEVRALPEEFNPNEHLEAIRTRLNKIITKHGLKPVRLSDLAPLRESPAATAKYIVKDLYVPPSRFRRYVKGCQMIIKPKKLPCSISGPFCWVRGRSQDRREKYTAIAGYFGLDPDAFIARFPRNWFRILGSLCKRIEAINPKWPEYPSPAFDTARFCRRALWEQGLWDDDLGPEPEPYDKYLLPPQPPENS